MLLLIIPLHLDAVLGGITPAYEFKPGKYMQAMGFAEYEDPSVILTKQKWDVIRD